MYYLLSIFIFNFFFFFFFKKTKKKTKKLYPCYEKTKQRKITKIFHSKLYKYYVK